MKKSFVLLFSLVLILVFVACGKQNSFENDMEYVKDKGKLVVGITNFEPMDYKNDEGQWIGFDADMAKQFAEKLGVEIEFVEISWDSKLIELDGKTIDCVWNGMTLNDETKEGMECSKPYCNNAQVVIVPVEKADQYQTVESLSDLTFAVEAGSAGEKQVQDLNLNFISVKEQADALMEVNSGTADAAIIDSLMAGAMVGDKTAYKNLTYTVSLNSEQYAVGFRKGSNLAKELNDFLDTSYAEGTTMKIAEEYGVQAAVVEQ